MRLYDVMVWLALSGLSSACAGASRPATDGTADGAAEQAGSDAPDASGASAERGTPPSCPASRDWGVRWVGRHDGCVEDGVRTAWSGTGFVARFSGTGLRLTLEGPAVQYTVVTDGVVGAPLLTTGVPGGIDVVSGLPEGEHTVEVYRRGEASFGAVVVRGVEAVGGELLPPPPAPERLLEIVGDSISCGYGNEGTSPSCAFSADTENHYASYGAVLARTLSAEVSTVAWSGRGVVRNYAGEPGALMPALYEAAIPQSPGNVWDFIGTREPDAVIINLGTNDYSTDDPSDQEFTDGYVALLEKVRQRNPSAFILCTVGPMLGGSDLEKARRNIQAAVAARRAAGDERLTAYEMNTPNANPGCDYHPGLETHEAMARELAGPLRAALAW